jgi:mannose-6-phosphate isomerase-like protein (cupin superfamily)
MSRTTNGAGTSTTELSSNKIMRKTLDFDASTIEYVQADIKAPKGWDRSTVTVRFVWTFASGSGAVVWGAQAVACGDGDALDAAPGTAQEVTDTALTANNEHLTSSTAAITIAGTPASEDLLIFQFYRNAASGSDTLATDALLLGAEVLFNFDVSDDS